MKKLTKRERNKYFIIVSYSILLLGILVAGISYATYQTSNEVTFINAKVRWPRANEISYITTNNSKVTNVEEALNDLYGKIGK